MNKTTIAAAALGLACVFAGTAQAAPPTVEMTWMSIANWYFKIGDKRILMDGYITRIPETPFTASPVYPNDLYAYTKGLRHRHAVGHQGARCACSAPTSSIYLLVGHSHWDHSWDTPAWSKLTGAPMIGGASTCLQARGAGRAGRAVPQRQRRREDRARQRRHDARRALEPQRRRDQPDPALPARALPPAGARRGDRRPARRRRRGLSERRRQPRLPVHRRQRRRPALASSSTTRPAPTTSTRPSSSTASTTARRSATWPRR